jgi:hypothetical protein
LRQQHNTILRVTHHTIHFVKKNDKKKFVLELIQHSLLCIDQCRHLGMSAAALPGLVTHAFSLAKPPVPSALRTKCWALTLNSALVEAVSPSGQLLPGGNRVGGSATTAEMSVVDGRGFQDLLSCQGSPLQPKIFQDFSSGLTPGSLQAAASLKGTST